MDARRNLGNVCLLPLRPKHFAFPFIGLEDKDWNTQNYNFDGCFVWVSVGRDGSVGLATHYGLDGNPSGGEIFRTRPYLPWGLPRLLYNG
jgi:hypothetical protein